MHVLAAAAVPAAPSPSSGSGGQPGGGLLASMTRLANAMVNLFPVFVLGEFKYAWHCCHAAAT